MSIDIFNLPILKGTPEEEALRDLEMRENITNEGRVARRMKMPYEPPPYRIDDWQVWWKLGWQLESRRLEKELEDEMLREAAQRRQE